MQWLGWADLPDSSHTECLYCALQTCVGQYIILQEYNMRVWASEWEREVDRGVVDVLPKIVVELKYPLSIQIPYFRSSVRTISNKSSMFSMMHSNTLSLHHSDQCIIFSILYRFLIVIPPGTSTVSHPTWNGSWCNLYRRDQASRFHLNAGDIYKTRRFRYGSPNSYIFTAVWKFS